MSVLNEALDIHDENPVLARALLERIVFSELEEKDKNSFIWLVNHVVGEALADWAGAFALLIANKSEYSEAYFKSLSVAAYYSGNPLHAFIAEFEYARLANASLAETKVLVGLLCLQFMRSDEPIMSSLTLLSGYSSSPSLPLNPVIGKSMAAALNNTVSKLIEDSRLQVDDPFHKQVTIDAALLCKQLWLQCGTWINHERSLYLCALVFNRFSEWGPAIEVIKEAVKVIETNGSEEVDKAFLLLEYGKAQQGLGNLEHAQQKLDEADQIAKDFDPPLYQWFSERRAKVVSPE